MSPKARREVIGPVPPTTSKYPFSSFHRGVCPWVSHWSSDFPSNSTMASAGGGNGGLGAQGCTTGGRGRSMELGGQACSWPCNGIVPAVIQTTEISPTGWKTLPVHRPGGTGPAESAYVMGALRALDFLLVNRRRCGFATTEASPKIAPVSIGDVETTT